MKRVLAKKEEKVNKFHNFEQRNYDYDELERMLLTTRVSED